MLYPFKVIVMLIIAFVVLGLSAVLVVVWTMPDMPDASIHSEELCLSTECGQSTDILHDFLSKSVAQQYEELKTKNELSIKQYHDEYGVRLMAYYSSLDGDMKPAIRLTGAELPEAREGDCKLEMVPIRHWNHGRHLHGTNGFSRFGMQYRNGRIVVPLTGTYFIYSFVDLFEPCIEGKGIPDVEDASHPIKHGMYKYDILEVNETELTSSSQPHMIPENKYYNSYSSYISTLAELKAGDEISVKVSNITYLKYTSENYFGAHLI